MNAGACFIEVFFLEKPARIGINGFGRIGRALFRVLLSRGAALPGAVNELASSESMAHLLRYDSVHGRLNAEVAVGDGLLAVAGRGVRLLHQEDPSRIDWRALGIDMVVECTGKFTDGSVRRHLDSGASRVIVSAPSDAADLTVVYGVNHVLYEPGKHAVISGGSCTTNCIAPIAKVLNAAFGINKGLVTTVHSYTNDQKLLDQAHRDFRRGRSAGVSLIPTTTGAAKAVGLVLPELAGKLDGVSVRVPTPDVSLADITLSLAKTATSDEINSVLREASENGLCGVLGYSDEPLVSSDYRGSPFSSVVDGLQTRVVEGDMVKVTAWYDNEWGYANRLADLIAYIEEKGGR